MQFAGGHDPGPLALPSDTEDRRDDDEPEDSRTAGQLPPPVPRGPWSDADEPAGRPGHSPARREGPWGRHN